MGEYEELIKEDFYGQKRAGVSRLFWVFHDLDHHLCVENIIHLSC